MARTARVEVATVVLGDRQVGAVSWDQSRQCGLFEYTEDFARSGLEVSPFHMPPKSGRIYQFPELDRQTFHGLPGLLADSLPDRFGNMLINQWLSRQGRSIEDFSPIERLCYMGSCGMGALEFKPSLPPRRRRVSAPLEIAEMVELANAIMRSRGELAGNFMKRRDEALDTIFRVGTSAGGARAKAVIAYNPVTEEVQSGQFEMPPGFEAWLLKFDGVSDDGLTAPQGFGRVEYAYHRMAKDAGLAMEDCRLLPDRDGRVHFMTRRFDRLPGNKKVHMQSLCGLAHMDFNKPAAYGYENIFATMRRLSLGNEAAGQMFRRMVFNILARNQDDHTRNFSFLMTAGGQWKLAPAYDVTWCYNPDGGWTARHQLQVNGKRDGFEMGDLLAVARGAGIRNARDIIAQVGEAVSRWKEFAEQASVPAELAQRVGESHRRPEAL